jgi:transposase
MTRGKPLSDDLRKVILNMGMTRDISTIVELTRLKCRTVERIFQDYRNKGMVMWEHLYKELHGQKHSLTVSNTKVKFRCASPKPLSKFLLKFLCGLVRHSPDNYLAELQEILEDRLGLEVNESTIWRSLKRCGFIMKKVRLSRMLEMFD